jgi:two-component system, cell cycle response regulator
MLANNPPTFLLASPEPALLTAVERVLLASGARVEVVLSAEAALASMTAPRPPSLALLDISLPGLEPGTEPALEAGSEIGQLLAAVRACVGSKHLPIVLITDSVTEEWSNRLAEGVIDDLIPRSIEPPFWQVRVDQVLRNRRCARELETLREGARLNAQMDHLTGVYNRETILAMLFRETDRVQRLKSSLCAILFDIDDFGHWNSRLGAGACDDLLCQIVDRTSRLLRTYDLLGRPGMDEFLIALPGCSPANAAMLAERIRLEVFCPPFRTGGESIRLSACFGIANSQGRSPMVVLREAEQALQMAKYMGPESIQCVSGCPQFTAAPVALLSPTSGDELLAW